MATVVDQYFRKSKSWREEGEALREILRDCPLDEQLKWGKPCYSAEGGNIAIIQKMKSFIALMFFKGALLSDSKGLLREQGKNTRSARRLEFTSVADVEKKRAAIKRFVRDAIKVEKAGLKVEKPTKIDWAPEFKARLKKDRALRKAFDALTPGRKREYNIYFSGAKQSETRERRIDRYAKKILDGKGFRDR